MESPIVPYRSPLPALELAPEHENLSGALCLQVAEFHPRSVTFRPATTVRILHDGVRLGIWFRVEGETVKASHTRFQDPVYEDSCVEAFFQPFGQGPYVNVEVNALGTLLMSRIHDATRTRTGFAHWRPLTMDDTVGIKVATSVRQPVPVETLEPRNWHLSLRLPFSCLTLPGSDRAPWDRPWRANFFKCADGSRSPHWASWQPNGPDLNFHQPDRFGVLLLEPPRAG